MTTALRAKPTATDVDTGVSEPATVADALTGVLADTYSLLIKTHAVHWNVEGPMFHAVHTLTEDQYTDLFAAADVIAERIRALGQLAPLSPATLLDGSVVTDIDSAADAITMCGGLAGDHGNVARRLHDVIDTASKVNDHVTADLATARAAFHEKAAWMLRALART